MKRSTFVIGWAALAVLGNLVIASARVPQAFPNVPPVDLVGPLAYVTDCQTYFVDGYSVFIRSNIARSFTGAPVPCRGQHVTRPIGNRPNPSLSNRYMVVWVLDPARPLPAMTWTAGNPTATLSNYAGYGLRAIVRINHTTDGYDGTGVSIRTDADVNGGGGVITREVKRNSPYAINISRMPDGYELPQKLNVALPIAVTDKDVLVVIEAIKPRT